VNTFIILVVYLVGVGLMFSELLLPGVVLGVLGTGCVIASIAMAFSLLDTPTLGWVLTGVSVVLVPLFVVLWIKFIERYFSIKGSEKTFTSSEAGLDELLGREGVTLTPLRPAGVARFGESRVDVVAMGEVIEKDRRVKVVEVKGNRVVVRRAGARVDGEGIQHEGE